LRGRRSNIYLKWSHYVFPGLRLLKKVPYSVLPSLLFLSCLAIARHPSHRSGRRPGMSSRGTPVPRDPSAYASGRHKGYSEREHPTVSSRGAQALRDPSLRSGRQKKGLGRQKKGSGRQKRAWGDKKKGSGRQQGGLHKFLKQPRL